MQTIQNAIGGKLVTSTSTRTQPVFNPATGEAIATLPLSTLDSGSVAMASPVAGLNTGWVRLLVEVTSFPPMAF